jgi:hypothetical protein
MSTNTITKPEVSKVDDLRKVYTQVSEGPATPGEVVQAHKGINSRYARELLKTLEQAEFVILNKDGEFVLNGDGKDFDEWAGTAAPAKVDETKDCTCGCGEQVPIKSFYRPGHDARHAGVIGREIAANVATPGFDRRDLLNELPSDKLAAKAEDIAEKAIDRQRIKDAKQAAKDAAKAAKEAPKTEDGTVKVGKKEFAATREIATGEVVYYDGDQTKAASKTAAKTFTV